MTEQYMGLFPVSINFIKNIKIILIALSMLVLYRQDANITVVKKSKVLKNFVIFATKINKILHV